MSKPAAPDVPSEPPQPGIVSDPDAPVPDPKTQQAPNPITPPGDPKGGGSSPDAPTPPSGFPEGDDFVKAVTGMG